MAQTELYDPGRLIDDDLELVLIEKYPGNPAINHVPAYKFKIMPIDQDEEIGRIELKVGNTNHIVMYTGHMGYRLQHPTRTSGTPIRCQSLQIAFTPGAKSWIESAVDYTQS